MEIKKNVQTEERQNLNNVKRLEENNFAMPAMVLGIIGFVLGIIPFIGWFAVPLSILAIIFGVLGVKKEYKRGQAIAGLLLGAGLLIWKIVFWIFIILLSAV